MPPSADVNAAAAPTAVARAGPWMPLAFLVAVPVLLYVGRDNWFFLDEWEPLVNRELTDPSSLLRGHNGHWITLPTVAYRLLFQVFGVTTYAPYQALSVTAHVAVAVAAVLLARRLGVRAWLAALVIAPFVVFGAGRQNIFFGFNISLTWAFIFGTAHLLLADHRGPIGRRDALGLACGFAALMCSAIGVAFAVGVGVSALIARGWRVAAAHVVPLATVYLAWMLLLDDDARSEPQELTIAWSVVEFAAELVRASFAGLGQRPVAGVVLGAVAALGLVEGARRARVAGDRRWLGLAAALLVTLATFAVTSGAARVGTFGVASAGAERYVHVGLALLLPFLAVGAETLWRWHRAALAVVLVPLVVGIPGNVDLLRAPRPFESDSEVLTAALARSPVLVEAPGDLRFAPAFAPEFGPTVDWLRAAEARDRIPHPEVPPAVALQADLRLALHQEDGTASGACTTVASAQSDLAPGDELPIDGLVDVVAVEGATRSFPMRFDAAAGSLLVTRSSLRLEVAGVDGGGVLECAG